MVLLSEKGTPKGKYKNREMQNAKIEKNQKVKKCRNREIVKSKNQEIEN